MTFSFMQKMRLIRRNCESNWAQIHGGRKYTRMGEKESGVYSCYLSAKKISGLPKEVSVKITVRFYSLYNQKT